MENKLTEINRKDLPLLQRLYNPNEPDTYIAYTTIDTYIGWFEQNPSLNNDKVKFYCLNGDFSHGTFVVTVSDKTIIGRTSHGLKHFVSFQDDYTHSAYADTLSENTDELFQLLLLIDYSIGYLFCALGEGPESALKQALKHKNVEHFPDFPSVFYRLPKEKALEFDIQ